VTAPEFTPQLRPLSIGEVLDAGFRLFRQRFGALMLAVLVPTVSLSILATVVLASSSPDAFDVNATTTDASGGEVAGAIVSYLLQGIAAALAVAACFKLISAAYLGERAGVRDSLAYAMRRVLALFVAYVLAVLILFVPLVMAALFLPFVALLAFFAVKLSMVLPAIVIERRGPFRSIGRSWKLTRKHWWRTFGTLLVATLLLLILLVALTVAITAGVFGLDDAGELTIAVLLTLSNILTTAVMLPLTAAILTVQYYDLRVRKEAFDLELLARGVGADHRRFTTAPERAEPSEAEPVPASTSGFAPPRPPDSHA
jgi:hypothetical protein